MGHTFFVEMPQPKMSFGDLSLQAMRDLMKSPKVLGQNNERQLYYAYVKDLKIHL